MNPSFLAVACSRKIASNALRISLVVGCILNLINQGASIMAGSGISWRHVLLNFFVPYCVASYSAAKNELGERGKHDEQ
jgi:hypothetical protein